LLVEGIEIAGRRVKQEEMRKYGKGKDERLTKI
jgi:hypothetical protein